MIYMAHYLKEKTPEFHIEIYSDLQDEQLNLIEIIAFRGSAKSTIASLIYPLWCAIFKKRRFIILCSDTHTQAKQIITNLIYELEHNERLIMDFGSFEKAKEDWTATNIFLKNGVRIMSRSQGQKIRGLRHLESRPDLIVLDDVESAQDIRTRENRDKTEEWLLSDVMPAIDQGGGKIVIVGNMLHKDGIMARMKAKIAGNNLGVVKEYPLMSDDGISIWPSVFDLERIELLKARSGLRFFQREYLLKIIASDDQVVRKISYYDTLPRMERISIGVDLAISQSTSADYTAINIAGENENRTIYNIQNIYGKWVFNETLERIWDAYKSHVSLYPDIPIYLGIEDVAFQKAAIEEFYRRYGVQPIPVKQTRDKRARIEVMAPHFENGQILFKREGMDDLIDQLLNFGVERHDDCVDAAEISWRLLIEADRPQIQWL